MYYAYDIVNKSPNTYTDFRLAQWADIDLGYYYDDFIGFDSARRMGITYNGTDCDGCAVWGPPPPNSYGSHIPVMGITIVSQPGDNAPTSYVPAGAFTYYNNDFSVIGNPVNDTQCNYYMRARFGDTDYFRKPLPGQHCIPSYFPGDTATVTLGPPANYVYTGDPGNDTTWSECTCGDNPGDRRFILSSNDFTLLPGSTNRVVVAMVTTALDSPNGCPHVSFDSINIYADTAWAIYYNPLPTGVQNILNGNGVELYPNPAHDKLYVKNTGMHLGATSITVYNTLGQVMNVSVDASASIIDISQLPPGMYYLCYRNGGEMKNEQFIKE